VRASRSPIGALRVPVVHPFSTGRLARLEVAHRFLARVLQRGDVWFAPMEEIAAHVRTVVDKGRWSPRIDRLPYYAEPVRVR
jgi:hypothetical protein